MGSLAKKNLIVELQDLDWNFTGETGSDGLFGVHWYPARYVAQVPGILIGYLSDAGDTVLDPFCGSGTTLIEAARQGRRPIGIDTNPVAVLMSNAKLVSFEESEWRAFVGGVTSDVANLLQGSVKNSGEFPIPSEEENRRWYHPETLRELAAVWHALDLADGPLQGVGRAAFSSILRSVCGQDKHWGWICDNVKPRELKYRPAVRLFSQKLGAFKQFTVEMYGTSDKHVVTDPPAVFGTCAEILRQVSDRSIDAVVTSPPYYCMTDYIRSQRLTFLWFGWNLNQLKISESGARYKRFRQNSRSGYLDEMEKSFVQISRVLKPGGRCAVVIGESPHRAPVLSDFDDLLKRAGLEQELKLERSVPKQRAMSPQLHFEEIIIARKF